MGNSPHGGIIRERWDSSGRFIDSSRNRPPPQLKSGVRLPPIAATGGPKGRRTAWGLSSTPRRRRWCSRRACTFPVVAIDSLAQILTNEVRSPPWFESTRRRKSCNGDIFGRQRLKSHVIKHVPDYSVRRESRRSPVGANPIRPIGRSAGSNQSDEGGNEFVEVLW